MINFGTIKYWKDKWQELHFKYRPGDTYTRMQMKEAAQKILAKKQKEDKKKSGG